LPANSDSLPIDETSFTMKILDKAAKLEKALLDRIARRTDIVRHPIEVYRAILDDCEDATEAGSRGARIFPYSAVQIIISTPDAHYRATAEAVFAERPSIEERVRTRLRDAGCGDADNVTVTLTFVDSTPEQCAGHEYRLAFSRSVTSSKPARPRKARAATHYEVHLAVLAGKATKTRYSFDATRINLGRLGEVLDSHQRLLRQNHVSFVDAGDETSQSVSRAHAHIRFDEATGDARLHDDGSTHGTRVVRSGRTIEVPRGAGRGVALRNADEVVLGQARLRVEVRPTRAAR
jgi:hypothetical protein